MTLDHNNGQDEESNTASEGHNNFLQMLHLNLMLAHLEIL
jgi:hypothetical protein